MFKKVLVVRFSSLGDVVLTTPVFRNIKEASPDVYLSVLVKEKYIDVYKGNPYIDEIIPFTKAKGLLFCIRNIRRRNFDLLIDLHNNTRSNIIAIFSGIKSRVTYDKDIWPRRLFVCRRKISPQLEMHTVERYLKVLEKLGVETRYKQTEMFFAYDNNIIEPPSKRILIIQTAFLGDVILTIPLIAAIKKKFPDSFLSVMVIPSNRDILQGHPSINDIILFDKKVKDKGLKGLGGIIGAVKGKHFDIAVLPHRSFRSALISWLAGIKMRVGFDTSQGKIFLNTIIKYDRSKHDVDRNLELAKGIYAGVDSREIFINTSADDWIVVKDMLRSSGIVHEDILVGINPGSVWPTKRWFPERFAELADRIVRELNAKIIIFGGAGDIEVTQKIIGIMNEDAVNTAGKLTLKQLAACIKGCRVFVTNDSGPMHIAVANRVPVVAIFGPTTKELGFYPYGEHDIVIENNLSCRPCGLHGGKKCKLDTHDCMRNINVEDVFQAVKERLCL